MTTLTHEIIFSKISITRVQFTRMWDTIYFASSTLKNFKNISTKIERYKKLRVKVSSISFFSLSTSPQVLRYPQAGLSSPLPISPHSPCFRRTLLNRHTWTRSSRYVIWVVSSGSLPSLRCIRKSQSLESMTSSPNKQTKIGTVIKSIH